MTKFSKYIGLDAHKETIAVGIADGRGGLPRYWGKIANRPRGGAALGLLPQINSRAQGGGFSLSQNVRKRGATGGDVVLPAETSQR